MYDGGITLPIKSQRYNSDQYSPGEVIDEFVLNAGEVLYIPRGVMHAAASTSETSLHITLGFLGYSWAELLVHVLGEVTQSDAYWRDNMPFGFEHDSDKGLARLKEAFKERLHRFIDEADITPAIQAHLWQIQAFSRPRESRFLTNAINARIYWTPPLFNWYLDYPFRLLHWKTAFTLLVVHESSPSQMPLRKRSKL